MSMAPLEFETRVKQEVSSLGYRVISDPTRIPGGKSWLQSLAPFINEHQIQPDFLVENDGDFVVVEAKVRPLLLGAISQAMQYSRRARVTVVICVPNEVYDHTPGSVKHYAQDTRVYLCPLRQLRDVLQQLIG